MAIEIQVGKLGAQVTDKYDSHKWETIVSKDTYSSALLEFIRKINKKEFQPSSSPIRIRSGKSLIVL